MTRNSLATVATFAVVALLLAALLLADGVGQSPGGLLGSVIREIAAVLRDPETQWMVFLCLGVYFTLFLILRLRGNGARTGAHGVTRPTFWISAFVTHPALWLRAYATQPPFWLVCTLAISALVYAFDYSSSTQALTLLGGAVLGQGAGFLKSGKRKAESGKQGIGSQKPGVRSQKLEGRNGFVAFVVIVFILLLTLASVWQVESGHTFEYRTRARWSGPWDNPNHFGLLMGVGVVLAFGGAVLSFKFSKLGRRRGDETLAELGTRNSELKTQLEPPHVVSYKSRISFLLLAFGCLVAAGFMARGLLHSYSRGAWVATFCGLCYVAVSWFRVSGFELKQRSEVGKAHLTPTLSPRPPGGEGESFSCSSCVSWLKNNWLPIFVILASILILCFWHFRQTEWHPARRAFSAVNTVDFSWRNRVAAWEGALQILAERPWFGAGWNKPEPLYEHYYLSSKLNESAAIQMNDYLMLGATLGIPALFCFGMYIALSLREVPSSKFQVPSWGAHPPRALFSAPSRKTSDVHALDAALSNHPPDVGCGAHPTTPGAGVLPGSGTGGTLCPTLPRPSSILNFPSSALLAATCRAGAIVLLIGFWFDGGLFKLPTAATFWILLELGSAEPRMDTNQHE